MDNDCIRYTTITKFGNGCDAMTQRLLLVYILSILYFTVDLWDDGSPRETGVLKGTEVIMVGQICPYVNGVDLKLVRP